MAAANVIAIDVRQESGRTRLEPRGDWTAATVGALDDRLRTLEAELDPGAITIDLSGLGRIDTAGAFALGRVLNRCAEPEADFHYVGAHPTARRLMRLVRDRMATCPPPPKQGPGIVALFDRAGRGLISAWDEFIASMSFFGEMLAVAGRGVISPHRVRWASVFHVMEQAGLNALPIIATLSFFIGAVVAYLGANLLQQFGASIFAVELVALSVLREFGVVITAILLAGRSDSAFTAQIGAMRMQQEIDAMRVLGLDPFEALVLPRVLAVLLMTPLLTFGAMMMGMIGGMVVLWAVLDIAPGLFVARVYDTVPVQHFWAGMAKAPVFAVVIGVIGCRQGLLVGGDVESLGRRVTASVVQSIFAVIVIDAIFAMVYLELDI